MEERFNILRIISIVFRVLGVLILIIGLVFSVALPVSTPQPAPARIAAFLAAFLATILYALFLYATGEIILLGLAIEENTRATRDLLARQ